MAYCFFELVGSAAIGTDTVVVCGWRTASLY